MARDFMMIYDSTTPNEELCAMLRDPEYFGKAKAEAARSIKLLEQTNPPEAVHFVMKRNAHDFGDYFTLEAQYDDESEEESAYVLWLESHAPCTWDEPVKQWPGLEAYKATGEQLQEVA